MSNGNAKQLTSKGTLRQVSNYLRPRIPYTPPPYTLYTYLHREGERGVELNQR
jgi:hypothetical protein